MFVHRCHCQEHTDAHIHTIHIYVCIHLHTTQTHGTRGVSHVCLSANLQQIMCSCEVMACIQ